MRARRRKQPRDAVGGFDESSKCGGWHGAHTDGRRQRKGAAFDSGVALHRFVSGSSEVEGKWHRSCRFTARDQNPIQFSRNRENRRRFAASSPRVPSSSRGYGRRLRDDHFRPAFGVGTLTLPPLKPTSFGTMDGFASRRTCSSSSIPHVARIVMRNAASTSPSTKASRRPSPRFMPTDAGASSSTPPATTTSSLRSPVQTPGSNPRAVS